MRNKKILQNIDNSDLVNFPNGRIKDNTGVGDGTPVNEQTKGDIHEFFDKMLRLYGITHNDLPDNESNGYQTIEALRGISSKNTFITDLVDDSGTISVSVKLGFMLANEQIVCKSTFDKAGQTNIKGSDNSTYSVTFIGNFKTGEYVRLIKTTTGIILVRLVDFVNLDLAVSEFFYLKKASQAQENAGALDTVATTPLTNKSVFAFRTNDNTESANYLATLSRNGLYPKEHFSIVASIGASPIKNIGYFTGYNTGMGPAGTPLTTSGDITSAVIQPSSQGSNSIILCTMANAMANTNYKVSIDVESLSDILFDNDLGQFVFKVVNTTQFQISNYKITTQTQNLKIHLSVIQL